MAEYAPKGRQLYVEGRLQTRNWEDKDGVKRYTTEVVANNVQLLNSANGAGNRPEAQPGYKHPAKAEDEAPINIPEDDIPF